MAAAPCLKIGEDIVFPPCYCFPGGSNMAEPAGFATLWVLYKDVRPGDGSAVGWLASIEKIHARVWTPDQGEWTSRAVSRRGSFPANTISPLSIA